LKLENGKTFTIKTKNRNNALNPVKEISLNGKPYSSWQLSHENVTSGGVLEFVY
jgi:putative alpha-1,2-mannosidase